MSNEIDEIIVIIGYSAWNDINLISHTFEGTEIKIASTVSNAADLADQARSLDASCILFSPTLPGMNCGLIQELLLHDDRPISAVGLIPAGTQYAGEYQLHGMKGYVTTPLDVTQVKRLPDLIREAVRLAHDERNSRAYTPVSAEDALAILDRGGWQQQTIALYSPKGGVGKTTLSANLAAALGVLAMRPTLLIDADMSRANSHILFNLDIEEEPRNMFSLFERVVAEGERTGRYVVRGQQLRGNVRSWKGKLEILPGIPRMHMGGLPVFVEDPDRTMNIFGDIIRESRGYWDFRVLDVGPDFNMPIHWAALKEADTVLLVLTPEKTTIADVAGILPALKKGFGTLQKFHVVLNGFSEEFGIAPKDVMKYLGHEVQIFATLPYAPAETRVALNTGQPLVLQKELTPIAKSIIDLGAKFYPPLEALGRKKKIAPQKSALGGALRRTFSNSN